MITKIQKTIIEPNREAYRRTMIEIFLDEQSGSLTEVMEYVYYVENLRDGNKIYLKRPTQLNKGVDFEVRVETINFRYGKNGNPISTGNRPKHSDIIEDIKKKKLEAKECYGVFCGLIDKVYRCEEISDEEYTQCNFNTGYSVELILKVLKWLFIEQDITYWNRSGREMLYDSIKNI